MKYYRILIQISISALILIFSVKPVFAQDKNRLKIAAALEKSGSYEESLDIYLTLFNKGNSSHTVISGIKKNYVKLRRYEEMINFFNPLIKRFPKRINYKIDLGSAYYLNDNKKQAMEIWEQVYNSQPPNSMNYRLTGMAMIELRLYDEAAQVYKKAIQNIKNQESLYRDIAMLYKARLNYEQAVQNNLLYYSFYKKQINYVRSQIISMSKDDEAVERIIASMENFIKIHNTTDAVIEELLAGMYIKKKDFEHAFSLYKKLHKKNIKQNYLWRFAREAEANNAFDYSIKAYQTALSAKISDQLHANLKYNLARSHYYLGRQLAAKGKNETGQRQVNEAIRLLEEVIQKNAAMQFTWRSIELQADINQSFYNDIDKAIRLYERLTASKGRKEALDRVKIKLGNAYLLKNDLQTAGNYYNNISTRPYQNLGAFNLAEIDYFKGQFAKAKEQYERLLSNVLLKDSLTNNAMERIITIEQYVSDSTALAQFSAAGLLERRQKLSEAAKIVAGLFEVQKEISPLAGIEAALIYIKLDKLEDGQNILNKFTASYKDDRNIDRAYFLLADIYNKQQNYKQALDNYRTILVDYPASFYLEQARERARALTAKLKETKLP
jgi:tetratricopeptide (TPR) repeat protein